MEKKEKNKNKNKQKNIVVVFDLPVVGVSVGVFVGVIVVGAVPGMSVTCVKPLVTPWYPSVSLVGEYAHTM